MPQTILCSPIHFIWDLVVGACHLGRWQSLLPGWEGSLAGQGWDPPKKLKQALVSLTHAWGQWVVTGFWEVHSDCLVTVHRTVFPKSLVESLSLLRFENYFCARRIPSLYNLLLLQEMVPQEAFKSWKGIACFDGMAARLGITLNVRIRQNPTLHCTQNFWTRLSVVNACTLIFSTALNLIPSIKM